MRSLIIAIVMMFLSMPAFAGSTFCRMDGPHNCVEQNEDQLVNITKNTIHQMQLTHDQHAFKTQNDVVLEMAARQQAQLSVQPGMSSTGMNAANDQTDRAFWR